MPVVKASCSTVRGALRALESSPGGELPGALRALESSPGGELPAVVAVSEAITRWYRRST